MSLRLIYFIGVSGPHSGTAHVRFVDTRTPEQ